jgi:hypothetical protein
VPALRGAHVARQNARHHGAAVALHTRVSPLPEPSRAHGQGQPGRLVRGAFAVV